MPTDLVPASPPHKHLLDDSWPWFAAGDQTHGDSFCAAINQIADSFFDIIVTRDQVAAMTRALAEQHLNSDVLVLVPLMSAAGVFLALSQVPRDLVVLPMPLSRHPFWSLMPRPQDALPILQRYEALARSFMSILEHAIASGKFRKVVFFDSNSATGRDFAMTDRLVQSLSLGKVSSEFLLLCNETTSAALDEAFGHREGKKLACAKAWGLHLVNSNVKYTSHLYTLLRYSSDELETIAEHYMCQYPDLYHFWNHPKLRVHSTHGYGPLGRDAEWKSRIRFAKSEEELRFRKLDLACVDTLRNTLSPNHPESEAILCDHPQDRWIQRIDDF